MKAPDIRGWWTDRAVSKIRDHYRYSLAIYANRHRAEKSAEDKFLIAGLVLYVALPVVGVYTGYYFLTSVAIFAFIGAVFFPFIMSFYEQYQLAKKLTLTMNVIADNPEQTHPIRMRLQGVEFGAPMSTKEELITFLSGLSKQKENKTRGVFLTRRIESWRSKKRKSEEQDQGYLSHSVTADNGEAARIAELARDRMMKVYPMTSEGDDVPTLTLWPDDPEKCLRPRAEKVRLSYGVGRVRHATTYALECKPVKTSIRAKDKIIDVEYALFNPFFSQSDINHWLHEAEWFVPTRVAQEVAAYVKQQADMTKNASFFGTLEKQRDDAVAAYDRLLLHQTFSDVQKDVEGDVMEKYRPRRKNEDYLSLVVTFALGFLVAMLFF